MACQNNHSQAYQCRRCKRYYCHEHKLIYDDEFWWWKCKGLGRLHRTTADGRIILR